MLSVSNTRGDAAGVAYAAGPLKSGDPAGGDLTGTYPDPVVADGAITPAKLNAGVQFTNVALGEWQGTTCADLAPGWYNNFDNALVRRVGYSRDSFGMVHLRGQAINCTGSVALGTTVFVLPAGFRPDLPPGGQETFAGLIPGASPRVGTVVVRGAGNVEVFSVQNGESISFSGVTFRCGPSGQNGCP